MARTRFMLLAFIAAPVLGACGGGSGTAIGGVSPGEAEALNDAAAMVDEANQPKPGDPPKPAEDK